MFKDNRHKNRSSTFTGSQHCSPTKPTTTKNDIETSYLQNQRLDTVNILLPAPSYGMELGKDLGGLTEGVYVRNCDAAPYCLSYNIVCPLCAEARQHWSIRTYFAILKKRTFDQISFCLSCPTIAWIFSIYFFPFLLQFDMKELFGPYFIMIEIEFKT